MVTDIFSQVVIFFCREKMLFPIENLNFKPIIQKFTFALEMLKVSLLR